MKHSFWLFANTIYVNDQYLCNISKKKKKSFILVFSILVKTSLAYLHLPDDWTDLDHESFYSKKKRKKWNWISTIGFHVKSEPFWFVSQVSLLTGTIMEEDPSSAVLLSWENGLVLRLRQCSILFFFFFK